MESRRGSSGPRTTVLVVADDPSGALMAQALRRRGFDVASATSSATALKSVSDVLPAAIVVVLEPSAAISLLPLVSLLASDSQTHEIPVIVARCEDESLVTQAQRIGNVVVLLGDCSPETVAAEVDRVLLEYPDARAAQLRASFPVTCPKCGELAALPRSVATAPKRGTYLTLCCEKCGQQWRVFRQADTPPGSATH